MKKGHLLKLLTLSTIAVMTASAHAGRPSGQESIDSQVEAYKLTFKGKSISSTLAAVTIDSALVGSNCGVEKVAAVIAAVRQSTDDQQFIQSFKAAPTSEDCTLASIKFGIACANLKLKSETLFNTFADEIQKNLAKK